ncbi:hypothetical protein AQBE111736_13755 [Aquirufa beregesia]
MVATNTPVPATIELTVAVYVPLALSVTAETVPTPDNLEITTVAPPVVIALPKASFAVTVKICGIPLATRLALIGVKVEVAALATFALITIEVLVTAVPLAGVKVNVPVPVVPEYVNPVNVETPATKSAALVNLLVPDNPETVPAKLVLTVILLVAALNPVTVLP